MMEQKGPITSVPPLLALHDRAFVHAAYQAVLGRSPDPEGETHYLAQLRAGTHKLAILGQMRRSPEGRAFIPGVAGLDSAIRWYRQATLPLLGALVRLLTGEEGNGATHRRLRMLSNDIGRMDNDLVALAHRVEHLGQTPWHASPPADDDRQSIGTAGERTAMRQHESLGQRPGLAGFFTTNIWSR
jgi:hypothetical protein